MQAELVGDFAQHQRLHRDLAMGEEALLPFDDRLRDALDGVEALLDVLHEPARFLQARAQARRAAVGAAAVLADRLRIQVVDAQLGHHVGVEHDLPGASRLLHHHVGRDDVRLGARERAARLGLERDDQRLRFLQQRLVGAGDGHQLLQIAPREQFEVLLADDDRDRLRLAARLQPQLQGQALAEIACADARGLHALQPLQGAVQAFEQFLALFLAVGELGRDLFERVGEITVVVQRLDQHMQRGRVLGRQPHAGQLVAQELLQALRGGVAVLRIELVAVAAAGAAGARRFADPVEVVALGAVLPVVALGRAELGVVDRRGLFDGVTARCFGRVLGFALADTLGRRGALGQRLEHRGVVFLGLEEGVLLEHLLDFLVQFERRQLQQPDRLLQLRRQRQVLG